MRSVILFFVVGAVCLSLSAAAAQDRVVVVPLSTSPAGKLWGEGREGTTVTVHTTTNGMTIARSNGTASWDGAAAACPAGAWVCSKEEARNLKTDVATSNMSILNCNNVIEQFPFTWVRDQSGGLFGVTVHVTTGHALEVSSQRKCTYLPVWCCSTVE